ncbi:MAG: hypothetical protein ACOCXP_00220 [Candidatus Dojkabacteria bacterium]
MFIICCFCFLIFLVSSFDSADGANNQSLGSSGTEAGTGTTTEAEPNPGTGTERQNPQLQSMGGKERDKERIEAVKDIQIALETFLVGRNRYPEPDELSLSMIGIDEDDEELTPGKSSDTESTRYCYELQATGGYILGAKLESEEWFDLSSSLTGDECTDSSPPFFPR